MLKSAASSSFSIDWGAFGLVVVTSLVAAVVIVTFFSVALRLLSSGEASGETSRTGSETSATHRSPAITAVAYLCIAVCGVVVLYGLYLVIPLFHK